MPTRARSISPGIMKWRGGCSPAGSKSATATALQVYSCKQFKFEPAPAEAEGQTALPKRADQSHWAHPPAERDSCYEALETSAGRLPVWHLLLLIAAALGTTTACPPGRECGGRREPVRGRDRRGAAQDREDLRRRRRGRTGALSKRLSDFGRGAHADRLELRARHRLSVGHAERRPQVRRQAGRRQSAAGNGGAQDRGRRAWPFRSGQRAPRPTPARACWRSAICSAWRWAKSRPACSTASSPPGRGWMPGAGRFETPYHGPVYVIDAITNNPGAAGGALTNLQRRIAGHARQGAAQLAEQHLAQLRRPRRSIASRGRRDHRRQDRTPSPTRPKIARRRERPASNLASAASCWCPTCWSGRRRSSTKCGPARRPRRPACKPTTWWCSSASTWCSRCKALAEELEQLDAGDELKLVVMREPGIDRDCPAPAARACHRSRFRHAIGESNRMPNPPSSSGHVAPSTLPRTATRSSSRLARPLAGRGCCRLAGRWSLPRRPGPADRWPSWKSRP